MPKSCGLIRPSGRTAVASVRTTPAPQTGRLPRCTKCQSLAYPSVLEYWHIGETNTRFESVMSRIASGLNRWVIESYSLVQGIDRRSHLQTTLFTVQVLHNAPSLTTSAVARVFHSLSMLRLLRDHRQGDDSPRTDFHILVTNHSRPCSNSSP